MVRIYNYIILFLATLILSACQNSVLSDNAARSVLNNEKAVILYSASVNGMYDNAGLGWSMIDNNGEIIDQKLIPSNESYSKASWLTILIADVIAPGSYTLTDIVHGAAPGTTGTQYHLKVNNLMKFSIKPGEVIYLGHLIFMRKDSNIAFKVIDRFNDDYEKIKDMLPTLYPKIRKSFVR